LIWGSHSRYYELFFGMWSSHDTLCLLIHSTGHSSNFSSTFTRLKIWPFPGPAKITVLIALIGSLWIASCASIEPGFHSRLAGYVLVLHYDTENGVSMFARNADV
jgi:hypothetical protein